MQPVDLPSRAELLARFVYDPDTGLLIFRPREGDDRLTRGWNAKCAGKSPRARDGFGYVVVLIDRHRVAGHRVIWKMMTGEDPVEIDHRNGVPDDNRWSNLRLATRSQNNMNRDMRGLYLDHTGRFRVQLRVQGKHLHIGRYNTEEEARAAYEAAARVYYGEYARRPAERR